MRRRDRSAAVFATAAVWVGLFALGGAPRWATCLAAALALAAAIPYVTSRRAVPWRAPLPALIALAAGLTAAQLVPLPAFLVAWLSPDRHALAADNALALGLAMPRSISLSYDPPATLVELAKLLAYFGFALACTRVAATARGRRWLATTCAAAGAAMAITGLVHHALGADALFGLYAPRDGRWAYLAPLLNANHFAGFLALTTPLALALAVTSGGGRRLLWVGAATVCAATNLLLASRGGAVALGAGVLAAVGLLVAQRRRRRDAGLSWPVLVPAGVVAVCGLVLLGTLTAGTLRDELATTSVAELRDPGSKVGIWRATTDLVAASPWTGVGRGAFEPAFTRFHHGGIKTYSHVENEYLQAVADWGLPGAAALLLALGWVLLHAARQWSAGPIEAGALAGVAAIGLHAAADFNLELPGVALAALATLAIVLPARLVAVPAAGRRRRLALRGAGLAAGVAVIALAASPLGRGARDHGQELAALLAAPRPNTDTAASQADRAIARGRALIARHPADYLILGLTAQAYFRQRDPRAVRLANRALARNPRHPGLHMLAARMLVAAGRRGQALIEYGLALQHTLTPRDILADLVRWFPAPDEAALGIPAEPDRVPIMANRLVTMDRSDVALAYARRAYARHPDDAGIQRTVASLALARGDFALAVAAGRPVYERSRHARDALVLGRALRAAGHLDQAQAVLAEALALRRHDRVRQLVELHAALAEVQGARGDHQAARASLRAAIGLAEGRVADKVRAGLHRALAAVEERLGNARAAAEERARAVALDTP